MAIKSEDAEIGVIGLWHLGLVISASWSRLGFMVKGFDYSRDVVDRLNNGTPPIYEPGLKEAITESINQKRLHFTNSMKDLSDCDYVFLAFDTPVEENDEPDCGPLFKAVADVGGHLKDTALVIVSSQTPIGACSMLREALKRKNPMLELVYSPENLRLGDAINCYLNPDRIILGAAGPVAGDKALTLFEHIKARMITMDIPSAEMVKHAINAFLACSIVFANHLSDLCEATGANIMDVGAGMRSDNRIGRNAYLAPGIGYSGGTLGRDLFVLASINEEAGQGARLYGTLIDFNDRRPQEIIKKTTALLGGEIKGRRIAVLGLTYKPGTSTLRRSRPFEIASELQGKGAIVQAFDPCADYSELKAMPRFVISRSIDHALQNADMALVLTEWPEFRDYDWAGALRLMKGKVVFDAKNTLCKLNLEAMGFDYTCLGIPKKKREGVLYGGVKQ